MTRTDGYDGIIYKMFVFVIFSRNNVKVKNGIILIEIF